MIFLFKSTFHRKTVFYLSEVRDIEEAKSKTDDGAIIYIYVCILTIRGK
jgi:hypothetical protein